MFKRVFLFFIFFTAVILSACSSNNNEQVNRAETKDWTQVEIKGQVFYVEVPETRAEKARGLGGRESLAPDEGMLFVYNSPRRLSFWMKDMLIPLDFIWIRDGEVVRVDENIKPEDYQPPKTLSPEEKIDKVLELNAGAVEKNGIRVGDKVEFKK